MSVNRGLSVGGIEVGGAGVGGAGVAGGVGLLAETKTLLAAMAVAPDADRTTLINTLIGSLKTAGVWTKLDALWVFAAHGSADALLNWAAPGTFDATLVNAPTFTEDRGFTTNGIDNYVETNFNPSTAGGNFAQDSASGGYWDLIDAADANHGFGWFDGSDGFSLCPRSATNSFVVRANNQNTNANAMASSLGLSAINRTTSSNIQVYKNGALLFAPSRTSTALNNASFNIGRTTAVSFRALQAPAAFVGGSLDATEHEDLYDALAAYMTAVGAV